MGIDVEADSVGVLTGLTRLGGRYASVGSSGYGQRRLAAGRERPAFSALPSSAYFFDIDAAGTHAWAGGEKALLATVDGGRSCIGCLPPPRSVSRPWLLPTPLTGGSSERT